MTTQHLAIAALRHKYLPDNLKVSDKEIAKGLETVEWPARLQRLRTGPLIDSLPEGTELWLDGGHNVLGAKVAAAMMAELGERHPRPLYLILGMLANKDAESYLEVFEGLARRVFPLPVEGHDSHIRPGSSSTWQMQPASRRGPQLVWKKQ